MVDRVGPAASRAIWAKLPNSFRHLDRDPVLFQAGEEAAHSVLAPAGSFAEPRDRGALGAAQHGQHRHQLGALAANGARPWVVVDAIGKAR